MGEPSQASGVGGSYRAGTLDLDSPDICSPGQDAIDFDLVLVSVVPEPDPRIGPARLRDQLLQDKGLEEMSEALPIAQPLLLPDVCERGSQPAVADVNLWSLNESFTRVPVPNGRPRSICRTGGDPTGKPLACRTRLPAGCSEGRV